MALHTMKPKVGSVYRGQMLSRRWRSPGLRCTSVHPSLTYRQNLLSSLKTTERLPLSSRLYHDTRVAMLGNVVVSVVAWPEVDLIRVLLQADGFQWSWWQQHMPRFLPWMLFGQPLLLEQCIDLHVHLSYVAVQNLVYGCRNGQNGTSGHFR